MKFLVFLFVILGIAGCFFFTELHQYNYDFLLAFIINLLNAMFGYVVSKKYFNSDNSTFYKMVYGTMFLRFFIILCLMLLLINYEYVKMIPFFISFVCFYVLFQVFEIKFLIKLNKENKK